MGSVIVDEEFIKEHEAIQINKKMQDDESKGLFFDDKGDERYLINEPLMVESTPTIPRLNNSIAYSFKHGFYKDLQYVINLMKKHYSGRYKDLKKNFPDIFEKLKEEGYNT